MNLLSLPTFASSTSSAARKAIGSRRSGPSDKQTVEQAASLLGLPARLLPELPEPVSLTLHVQGAPVPVCLATYPAVLDPPVLADSITFDRDELRALALGVEADRLWHADFLGYCFEKWRSPGYRLTASDALAGANPDADAQWSLERVLQRLQAQLVAVELIADLPVQNAAPEAHSSAASPDRDRAQLRLPAAA